MNPLHDAHEIANALKAIPRTWDGKKAILAMKDANGRWRDTEWPGWYFQFLCEEHLRCLLRMPGPTYGNVQFDGLKTIPWDFKCHALHPKKNNILLNDAEAILRAVNEYGMVGYVLALGPAQEDNPSQDFKRWHDQLKGKKSQYVLEREARGASSRRRKVSYELQEIRFLKIDKTTLDSRCGTFQEDFRNANGSPRRAKVKINLEALGKEEYLHSLKF